MWSISCYGAEDQQKLMQEACSLVSQQRNSLSDAIAVSEARSKIMAEKCASDKTDGEKVLNECIAKSGWWQNCALDQTCVDWLKTKP